MCHHSHGRGAACHPEGAFLAGEDRWHCLEVGRQDPAEGSQNQPRTPWEEVALRPAVRRNQNSCSGRTAGRGHEGVPVMAAGSRRLPMHEAVKGDGHSHHNRGWGWILPRSLVVFMSAKKWCVATLREDMNKEEGTTNVYGHCPCGEIDLGLDHRNPCSRISPGTFDLRQLQLPGLAPSSSCTG